jgi:hypothetical protein
MLFYYRCYLAFWH